MVDLLGPSGWVSLGRELNRFDDKWKGVRPLRGLGGSPIMWRSGLLPDPWTRVLYSLSGCHGVVGCLYEEWTGYSWTLCRGKESVVVIRIGARSVRRNVDMGSGFFVGVSSGDHLCRVRSVCRTLDMRFGCFVGVSSGDRLYGVRSTRRYTGAGSGLFVGTPVGDRLCGSPVGSSVRRHWVCTLCRGT